MAEQNLDFNIIAHTQGMEQIANLINRVGALEAETKKLSSANATLASSTDSVIRNGVRYNNALDAQSKALRQNRQGTQQLGMQINDFATSVSTGASPLQAFNQQIGQVGYAMSQMGGKLGMVGGFLAGPWGAAVVIATMVLAPFIENMLGASSAAKELEDSEKKVRDSSIAVMFAKAELDKALGRNTNAYKEASAAALQAGLDDINSAKDALRASMARMTAAKQEAKALAILKGTGGATGKAASFVAGLFGFGDIEAAKKDTLDKTDELNKVVDAQYRLLARNQAALKPVAPERVRTGSRAAAAIQAPKMEKVKVKPEFSMLGFYEEFFAKEFQQNEETLAKTAETQIKSLIDTLPELAKISPEMDAILTRADEIAQSFDAVGNAVANSFKGMLTGAMSFKSAMKGIISAVIDELFRLFVVQQIVGFVTGTVAPALGINLPKRALGGSVTGNKPYMVGERGPELFVPGGNGTIIPNANMRGSGGGGSPISISVDARGSSDPAAVRAQVQQGILEAAPAIIAAAESRTIAGLRRPRLGGAMQ